MHKYSFPICQSRHWKNVDMYFLEGSEVPLEMFSQIQDFCTSFGTFRMIQSNISRA